MGLQNKAPLFPETQARTTGMSESQPNEFEVWVQSAVEGIETLARFNVMVTIIGSLATMINFQQPLVDDRRIPFLASVSHSDVDLLVRGLSITDLEKILKGEIKHWVTKSEKKGNNLILFLNGFPGHPIELHFGSTPLLEFNVNNLDRAWISTTGVGDRQEQVTITGGKRVYVANKIVTLCGTLRQMWTTHHNRDVNLLLYIMYQQFLEEAYPSTLPRETENFNYRLETVKGRLEREISEANREPRVQEIFKDSYGSWMKLAVQAYLSKHAKERGFRMGIIGGWPNEGKRGPALRSPWSGNYGPRAAALANTGASQNPGETPINSAATSTALPIHPGHGIQLHYRNPHRRQTTTPHDPRSSKSLTSTEELSLPVIQADSQSWSSSLVRCIRGLGHQIKLSRKI